MKRLMSFLAQHAASYPMTMLYLSGVACIIAVQEEVVTLGAGLILFTLAAIMAFVWAIAREVHTVHVLVNSQRDELLNRISDLIDALNEAGVDVPNRRQGATSAHSRGEHK